MNSQFLVRLSEGEEATSAMGERVGKGHQGRFRWMGKEAPVKEAFFHGREAKLCSTEATQNTSRLMDSKISGPRKKATISINTQLL